MEIEWTHLIILALLLIFGLHVIIECFYFLRMLLCFILATFVKRKVHILEKCSLSGNGVTFTDESIPDIDRFSSQFLGICTTRDVDMILTHMNNARYLREVDLARVDFYIRSRLYEVVRSQKGQILLGACNVRFRKFIGIFQRFKLTTKIVYWNEDSIFIEHKVSKFKPMSQNFT